MSHMSQMWGPGFGLLLLFLFFGGTMFYTARLVMPEILSVKKVDGYYDRAGEFWHGIGQFGMGYPFLPTGLQFISNEVMSVIFLIGGTFYVIRVIILLVTKQPIIDGLSWKKQLHGNLIHAIMLYMMAFMYWIIPTWLLPITAFLSIIFWTYFIVKYVFETIEDILLWRTALVVGEENLQMERNILSFGTDFLHLWKGVIMLCMVPMLIAGILMGPMKTLPAGSELPPEAICHTMSDGTTMCH